MFHKIISVLCISITLQVVLCKVYSFTNSQWPEECDDFFYMRQPPQNIPGNLDDYVVIAQMLNGKVHYCTLYNTRDRIAVFSAYQMHIGNGDEGRRQSTWYGEPQLSKAKDDNMSTLKGINIQEQATNHDYMHSYFDKGHLNPNFFQTGEGRRATFTLTNAVPQHPAFNRLYWFELERLAKKMIYKYCFDILEKPDDEIEDDEDMDVEDKGTTSTNKAYLITGAIPNFPSTKESPLKTLKKEGKVNIPVAMFTAACCFKPKLAESFSFGYFGLNDADTRIKVSNEEDLVNFLRLHWPENVPVPENLHLFHDNCGPESRIGDQIIREINDELHHQSEMRYEEAETFLYTKKMEMGKTATGGIL